MTEKQAYRYFCRYARYYEGDGGFYTVPVPGQGQGHYLAHKDVGVLADMFRAAVAQENEGRQER